MTDACAETVSDAAAAPVAEYVTVRIGDQLFGLPIARVNEVFLPEQVTPVPLAPPEVAGVLNLRGRIVTAVDMRRRLGAPPRGDAGSAMAVGVELNGESFGLIVDGVGEVLRLADDTREANPVNLDRRLARVSSGVHRLEGRLLVALDVDRVLAFGDDATAA